MDILASHRTGLVEHYAIEAAGLAGRGCDSRQRIVVYHHLFAHSGGTHAYALLCAVAAARLDPALDRVARAARRRRWRSAPGLDQRVEAFAQSLREIDAERCEAMQLAYRLARSPALAGEAASIAPHALLAALRGGDRRAAFLAHQQWFEARWGNALEAAIDALRWPYRGGSVAAVISALRVPLKAYLAAEARGWARTERKVISAKAMPAGFAANPAQHYYALQRAIAERRRAVADQGLEHALVDCVRIAA